MDSLRNLAARIDSLSVRERAIIMLAVLVVLYVAWDRLLLEPLSQRGAMLEAGLADSRGRIAELDREAEAVLTRRGKDPDEALRAERQTLERRLAAVKAELEESTRHLVPPAEIAGMLETVLEKSRNVSFMGLRGTGASPLLESSGAEEGAQTSSTLRAAFKHGVELEVEGGYLETLDLLRELESLPWAFFWDRIDLEVTEYPVARTSVVVFTLSFDREWIGV